MKKYKHIVYSLFSLLVAALFVTGNFFAIAIGVYILIYCSEFGKT